MSEIQSVGVAVREWVRYQSVSTYVATDRLKSVEHFNIRPQAESIRAFWCKMLGIIAHILFIMKDISVKYKYKL